MRRRLRRVLATSVAGGLVAAGCGGDDGRLSVTEFQTQLVAVCDRANQGVDEAQKALPQGDDPEAASRFGQQVAGVLRGFASGARALKPPKALDGELERFAGIIDGARAKFEAVPGTEAGSRHRALDEAFAALQPAEPAAQPLGIAPLSTCGGAGPAPAPAEGSVEVPVVAEDFEFTLNGTVKVGKTAFVMTNEGDERHFMALVQLKGGVSAEQVIDAERKGSDSSGLIAGQVGASNTAAPGERAVLNADLQPGTYGMACFVPSGDGLPHAFKGMYATIQVDAPPAPEEPAPTAPPAPPPG